jgi:hypothetical protein
MPFRQLPASDPTRTQALQGALKKSTSTTGAAHLISAATTTGITRPHVFIPFSITHRFPNFRPSS